MSYSSILLILADRSVSATKKYIIAIICVMSLIQYSEAQTLCDSNYVSHTYNWTRLNLKYPCVTMTGTIQLILPPATTGDGDAHIYVLPDTAYDSLVYSPSTFPTWLNVEETCVGTPLDTSVDPYCRNWTNPLYYPNVGEHVLVRGPWVFDPTHGWNEIHPVSKMEIVGATGVTDEGHTFLNNLKIMPQPANQELSFAFHIAPHLATYIRIYNILGRDVADYQLAETNTLAINTRYWPSGTYTYTISQDNEVLNSGKFSILH